MCGKKSSKSVVSNLETQDYLLNLLFSVMEEIHVWPVTLTLMICSWMDQRVKLAACPYFAVGCSGLELIGPVILAYMRSSLEKFRF
jgi:hypothetical protein